MRIGNEQSPFIGKPARSDLESRRPRVRDRDRVLDMKFTLPAVIEHTKRRITALLKLCDDEPGANRVDRPGGYEDDVSR
jgi:hypothetical protein